MAGPSVVPPWSRRVRIPLPADVDVRWTLRYLVVRTVDSLERIAGAQYLRSVRDHASGRHLLLDLAHDADGHALLARTRPALPAAEIRALVERSFDLTTDLAAFRALVMRDRVLGPMLRARPALRLPQLLDPFEGLIRAVLGQQVSVVGASTMTDRLVRAFGTPLAAHDAGPPMYGFPSPAVLAEAGAATLRTIGLTNAKSATLHGVSVAVATGAIDLEALRGAPTDEAEATLVALPGIGPWTAHYVRMRALGDRDAFPAADLGVLKAMDSAGIARRDILARAEAWRPWRAYATLHLWESLGKRE
ncbi:MAG: DNA-3-methyladenine glycosylase 2 family protein [Gemmatimonadaceae bacterium]|nr:DNA-3-methyladenine glycosylase 2 family protein [Gemmatimonadaceae bacterium]